MNILVTNDDGIDAVGLQRLATGLKQTSWVNHVITVAPMNEQSTCSHSLTLHNPLRVNRLDADRFAVSGTPADCVSLALSKLVRDPINLVISGINHGANVGTDIANSGTVSGAMQATQMGIPAIAVSLAFDQDEGETPNFQLAVEVVKDLATRVCEHGLPKNTLLNINVPNRATTNATDATSLTCVTTTMGHKAWGYNFETRQDPRGHYYYWNNSKVMEHIPDGESDIAAVRAGKVSVTPIHLDYTNYQFLKQLRDWKL